MNEAIVLQVLTIISGPDRGVIARTAASLGLAESTVRTWRRTGRIPAKWQPVLLALAHERGLPLEPRHFFYLDSAEAAGWGTAVCNSEPCTAAA